MISRVASTAKTIRQELKSAFPGVKFKVRSESYSGGSSVTIEYTYGPPTNAVRAIVEKYQDGHFDGMTDYYELDRNNIGGTKYVFVNRRFDDATTEAVARQLTDLFGAAWDGYDTMVGGRLAYSWAHCLLCDATISQGQSLTVVHPVGGDIVLAAA